MKLIEFDNDNLSITYDPLLLSLEPFKRIIRRDSTRGKAMAIKELSFIAFFTDIRSMYMYILDDDDRAKELIKDLKLPDDWKVDKIISDAIEFYRDKSKTVIGVLYEGAYHAVMEVAKYLKDAGELLNERDARGKVVTDISKITSALEKVPRLMQNLNSAQQELVKEQKVTEGRSKGARQFNMYEDGLDFEDE